MSIDIILTTPGAVAALAIGTLAAIQPTTIRAEDGAQLVDDLRAIFCKHHAKAKKGVILDGTFAPTQAARALSRAAAFAGTTAAVTIRLSDSTGIPDIPDNSGEANPRGLAIKFRGGGDADMDVVTHSFNGFPTATADEFGVLLQAIASSGPGAAKPTSLDKFLESHPIAKTFLTRQNPTPMVMPPPPTSASIRLPSSTQKANVALYDIVSSQRPASTASTRRRVNQWIRTT